MNDSEAMNNGLVDLSPGEAALRGLLRVPTADRPPDDLVDALRRMLDEAPEAALSQRLTVVLSGAEGNVRAGVRVADLIASKAYSGNGLRLVDALIDRFGRDDRLIDFRLRYQLALGMDQDLASEIREVVEGSVESVYLAYRVVLSILRLANGDQPIDDALHVRAVRRFLTLAEATPERRLWLGRYNRETGNAIAGLRHLLAFWEDSAEGGRFKAAALREAAELALSGDQWGRDAPVLLRAQVAKVDANSPWRAEAVAKAYEFVGGRAGLDALGQIPGTSSYSHVYAAAGSPEVAFDYLVDQALKDRAPYRPENCLLMFGTSLAGGGMERIFANSFRAVTESGAFDRVRMALMNFDPGAATAFYLPETGARAEDITVLQNTGAPEFPISLLPIGLARRVADAYHLIMRERPRVIHAWNDLPGVVAAFAGLLAGCPRIFVHFHHMRAINLSTDRNLVRSYPACYRRLLERPEIELLFVAEAAAEDYAAWWCVERSDKFRRLYNGFSDLSDSSGARRALRAELGIGEDAPVLGTVFRFDAVKRPWLWIDAAKAVHDRLPNAHFIMVGGGAELEAAKARTVAYGLADQFHFPGQVRNVPDYLASMDVFMLTSRIEGLPNSLVEAQLAGVPVVSTDVGGARETFIPGVTGRLVASDLSDDLATAVVECLTNIEWRQVAGAKAREAALERFSIERYLRSLMAIYEDRKR